MVLYDAKTTKLKENVLQMSDIDAVFKSTDKREESESSIEQSVSTYENDIDIESGTEENSILSLSSNIEDANIDNSHSVTNKRLRLENIVNDLSRKSNAFIPSSKDISNYEMSRNLQDFLICFEMLLAAIAHTYVFSHKEFVDSSRTTNPMLYTFTRIIDFTDERTDVYDHFRHIRTRLRDICIPPKNGYINIDDNSAPLIPMETRRVYGGVNEEHANTADFQKL
ncbi:hypothetical protein RDWZM_003217 [Blomia tropicalis]|uniref:Uncharacterized protein n=1 Tax=Blomia tropicalis TaxID=40697 RepID=A0A9Q0MHP3_BLOTA|nr:hypothetical protein RDWZM_003217 [Blomia tropicalis]